MWKPFGKLPTHNYWEPKSKIKGAQTSRGKGRPEFAKFISELRPLSPGQCCQFSDFIARSRDFKQPTEIFITTLRHVESLVISEKYLENSREFQPLCYCLDCRNCAHFIEAQ